MSIITKSFTFGKDICIVCSKELPRNRKWILWHSKCKSKGPLKWNKLLDKALIKGDKER